MRNTDFSPSHKTSLNNRSRYVELKFLDSTIATCPSLANLGLRVILPKYPFRLGPCYPCSDHQLPRKVLERSLTQGGPVLCSKSGAASCAAWQAPTQPHLPNTLALLKSSTSHPAWREHASQRWSYDGKYASLLARDDAARSNAPGQESPASLPSRYHHCEQVIWSRPTVIAMADMSTDLEIVHLAWKWSWPSLVQDYKIPSFGAGISIPSCSFKIELTYHGLLAYTRLSVVLCCALSFLARDSLHDVAQTRLHC